MKYINMAANLGESNRMTNTTDYQVIYTGYSGYGAIITPINVDTATTMQYKVDVYFANTPNAQVYPIIPETTLNPSTFTVDSTSITIPFAKMIIYSKHTTGNAKCQFDVLKY